MQNLIYYKMIKIGNLTSFGNSGLTMNHLIYSEYISIVNLQGLMPVKFVGYEKEFLVVFNINTSNGREC
jgi:hypothetical protein